MTVIVSMRTLLRVLGVLFVVGFILGMVVMG